MVGLGLASLQYPLFAFASQKSQTRPRKRTVQSSIRVPSSPSKLTKRKNYLRPKILKTLTKPYPIPPPTPDDPVAPIEPVDVASEPKLESLDSDSGIVVQEEELGDVNGSDSGWVEVVQVSEGQNVVGFSWFSGRMMFRIVASFVGLFVLQTVVAVWIMGPGETEEKDGNLGIRKVDVGMNGNANLGYLNVDDSEIEAKIAEIRMMAREAREMEKQNLENGEADMSDEEEEEEDETEASRIRNGIVKEVDGRLTKLRKNSAAPLLNVNLLNKAQDDVKEVKNEENDMLMFEMKRRFRSHSTAPREKPEGFRSIRGSVNTRDRPSSNVDNEKAIKTTENQSGSNEISPDGDGDKDREVNGVDSSFADEKTSDSHTDGKKPGSQSSSPQRAVKKGFGNNSGTRKLSKRRGVVQDPSPGNPVDHDANLKYSRTTTTKSSQMKVSDPKVMSTPEMHTLSEPLRSDEFGTTPSTRKNKDKQQIGDSNPWWLSLPYALVVLMQKGRDDEGLEGFYTLRINSDTESQSYTPYIVAFEDRSDAQNFSYLLELAFEDLPDASVDVVPLSTKDLKQVSESLSNKVVFVKKGELQLYAGQPLAEVETALRSLVK